MRHSQPHIAEVVFNLPLERSFHYLIPPHLIGQLQPGMRVAAPFGPRERVGYVLKLVTESPIAELRPLRRAIDPVPVIADERWALAEWLCAYYYCSLGEALAAMVPSGLRLPRAHAANGRDKMPRSASTLRLEPGALVQDSAPGTILQGSTGHTLSSHQVRAVRVITEAVRSARGQTLLLHGVTGSGKTEMYLQAIEQVMRAGRSTICLVPEIALTPQTMDRFRERFGAGVALWHSRLTNAQRAAEWQRLASGASRVVIGARSAVFAPVTDLGLVIIDEEHETTYKQEDTPRYHARDVALQRARLTRATVVLGSATPSVESYHAALTGRAQLLELPERVKGRSLPRVEVVDLREELALRHRMTPLSDRLQRALQQTVERGEQAMLLLNRRGFARSVQCQTCGTVVRCTRCAVPLIYHASRQALICHYCNFEQPPGEVCAACRKGYLKFRGAGTERIESELHRLYPVASIARMDRDTTTGRESHRQVYDAVQSGHVGLLVGTQMIAKGLDFPGVTLVGVVSADTALNLPDFRAGERTFDLLTQMAGRAGRGDQPGRVLIQTYCPTHYAILAAARHDYKAFYAEEIAMRRRLRLPPFAHFVELTVCGGSRSRVDEAADALAGAITHASGRQRITVLGPAPHRVPRLRRTYRTCLMLSGRQAQPMVQLLRRVLKPGRKFHGLPVLVDVDPL